MAEKIEEPAFALVERLGDVELRQYEPVVQARTPLKHNGETVAGFRRLAGFIFGGNERAQSIAMTAPVEETLGDTPVMAFTMPSAYALADLPAPNDSRVVLEEIPARTMAAIRFSGWATAGRVERKTRTLLDALEQGGVETVGEPSLNQYNPPWTPPFLRRNEIMVEVALD
jgi:effector-binding domain-containing protein